jgi:hypothetical protein
MTNALGYTTTELITAKNNVEAPRAKMKGQKVD